MCYKSGICRVVSCWLLWAVYRRIMAKYCSRDDSIGAAIDECYQQREKYSKTVNILLMDYAATSKGYEKLSDSVVN